MQSRSIYEYYWFGTCVRYLQEAQEGWILGGPQPAERVRANMESFFAYLDSLGLEVTKRATASMWAFYNDLCNNDIDHQLTPTQASALRDYMHDARKTLEAELSGFEAYVVTPKRFDVSHLLKDVAVLFRPGSFSLLPAIVQYDLAEAGRCTAFERPTAAAFHLMRGLEGCLRAFYEALVKRSRIKTRMWGPIVDDLRKQAKKPRSRVAQFATLLSHLDHIRVSFRNPTQHPEATYDVHQLQDLWGLAVDAINRMAEAL